MTALPAVAVDIVTVVVTAAPAGFTLGGEKLQEAPEGNPEQLNVTVDENPFSGLSDNATFPLCPDTMSTEAGITVTVKSCGGRLMT